MGNHLNALAQRMWVAYSAAAGGKTFDGKPLPGWSDLGEDRQACWVAAAQAALQPDEAAIARMCHEVNRAYCQGIGDNSQPTWEDAPDWQRDSAHKGVLLHLNNPDAGPQASHESWMAEKLATGWKYGPVKDPDKKEHHCIVPFAHLPREQQAKDYIFRGVVHAMAGRS